MNGKIRAEEATTGHDRAATAPRSHARRGLARYGRDERVERFRARTYQALLACAPATVLQGLTWTICAVASVIIFDCRAAAATCERRIANLAGSAAVSERSVQYALRKLTDLGLIAVQKRPGTTHRITIVSAEIEAWVKRAEAFRKLHLDREFSYQEEELNKAPRCGANDCTPPASRPRRTAPYRPPAPEVPPALPKAPQAQPVSVAQAVAKTVRSRRTPRFEARNPAADRLGRVMAGMGTELEVRQEAKLHGIDLKAPRTRSRRWGWPVNPDPSPETIKPGEGPCDADLDAIMRRLNLPPRGEGSM